jgi:ABC-2 type transport system permease protein
MVLIPIMELLLFGFAINSDPRNMPTAVISADQGILARNILSALENSQYFHIVNETTSEKQGKLLLQQGKISFLITIPNDFTKNFIRGNKPYILIEADSTDPIAIAGPLGSVTQAVDAAIMRDEIHIYNLNKINSKYYEIRVHKKYNPEGLSQYNIVPGLIAIVLTMTCIMMTALSLTKEKERGTLENLLSMPVKPIEVMIGKIGPYMIIGYIQAAIIILTAFFLFDVPIFGNLFLLAFGLLIFIICNLALGFTLSAAAQNQMQAMQMSVFFLLPSILLSGFAFPFRGMPFWAQIIGYTLPSTYFIRISRSIMLKGSDFTEIWLNVWPLLIFMAIVTFIAMKVYKVTLD